MSRLPVALRNGREAKRFAGWALTPLPNIRRTRRAPLAAAIAGTDMNDNKPQFYRSEAEKFRRMAVAETLRRGAREYYEALEHDFINLASAEKRKRE